MASLAKYVETRIADGNVTNALRTMIEGIAIGVGGYYDANPGTDTLTTYEGRPNLLADDDLVFYQKDPKGSVITGLSDESLYYVVNTNGLSMQVSATQGGQPIVLGSADKGVFSKVLVDYRQSQGTEILLAVKTNLTQELTDEELREFVRMTGKWLFDKKAEKDGVQV